MNNHYLDSRNAKALKHFKDLGYGLSDPYLKYYYTCCSACNSTPLGSKLVVDVLNFKGSNSAFHRYLKSNNLLF